MRILPVIDLMNGVVVRGVGGRRDEYRPVRSVLCDDPAPEVVSRAFHRIGLSEVYLADLDAIRGGEPNWSAYRTIIDCGLRLWVDAGPASADSARRLAEFCHAGRGLAAVVAGLESLEDLNVVAEMVTIFGSERLVFSLDLRDGLPMTSNPALRALSPEQIGKRVFEAGVRRFIVLDVAGVGTGRGVSTEPLCRYLRQVDASLEIVSGGGVRGIDDLAHLAAAGCDAALVASALHDGRLTAADLHRWLDCGL